MVGYTLALCGYAAWFHVSSAKFYQTHNVAENQFLSSVQVQAGSHILCLELCSIHDPCQAVTYARATATCKMGTLDMARSGGPDTLVWITNCELCGPVLSDCRPYRDWMKKSSNLYCLGRLGIYSGRVLLFLCIYVLVYYS